MAQEKGLKVLIENVSQYFINHKRALNSLFEHKLCRKSAIQIKKAKTSQ